MRVDLFPMATDLAPSCWRSSDVARELVAAGSGGMSSFNVSMDAGNREEISTIAL